MGYILQVKAADSSPPNGDSTGGTYGKEIYFSRGRRKKHPSDHVSLSRDVGYTGPDSREWRGGIAKTSRELVQLGVFGSENARDGWNGGPTSYQGWLA